MTSEVKNRNGKSKSDKPAYTQAQFINHSFTDDDKSKFKTWAKTNVERLGELIDYVAEQGYQLSTRYDDYSNAYASFLQMRTPKGDNYGFILSGRAGSSSVAILSVLYRHLVIFEGDWPSETVRKSALDDE